MDSEKTRVAVVYGGASGEHSISCVTAGAVMAALDPDRYDVISIGITRDGTWVPGETDVSKLCLADAALPEVAASTERVIIPPGDGSQELFAIHTEQPNGELSVRSLGRVVVVFPLLHGPFGEVGTIQGLLEMANLPYVGCGVFASAAGMDKHYMKLVLEDAGIRVSPYVAVTARDWSCDPENVRSAASELKFPLYVKPARAGSSLGISRIDSMDQLDLAIETAHQHDPKVLIEQGIDGREVECGVLGGHGCEPARASYPGEVILNVSDGEFYDFDHKYLDTAALTNQVPAHLPENLTESVRETARRAFDAFGCEGLTRVDCFVTADGEVLVNEINTMPGFTPFSMYPVLWENMGLSYSELVDELISLALERGTGLH